MTCNGGGVQLFRAKAQEAQDARDAAQSARDALAEQHEEAANALIVARLRLDNCIDAVIAADLATDSDAPIPSSS